MLYGIFYPLRLFSRTLMTRMPIVANSLAKCLRKVLDWTVRVQHIDQLIIRFRLALLISQSFSANQHQVLFLR